MSFRDVALGEILTYSLKFSATVFSQLASTPVGQQTPLLELLLHALKVINGCMTFDFAGRFDDTLENVAFNQMPLTWSTILLNNTLLQPIFDLLFSVRSEEHQVLVRCKWSKLGVGT